MKKYSLSDLVILEGQIKARIPYPPETEWNFPNEDQELVFRKKMEVWADKYKKEHKALYKIQEEISNRVTEVVNL